MLSLTYFTNFCLCMIVLFVLIKLLDSNNNIISFSSRNYFNRQLLSHGRTGNHLNRGLHHKICTLYLPLLMSIQLSSDQPWCSSFSVFYAFTWVDLSGCLVYSCSPLLKAMDRSLEVFLLLQT